MNIAFSRPGNDRSASHRARAHRFGTPVRLASAVVAASALALTLVSCNSAPGALQSPVAVQAVRAPLEAPTFAWFALPDSGQVETITVPDGVTAVQLSLTGAQGANASEHQFQGWGAGLDGILRVNPGDKLDIATGRQGEPNNSVKSPGAGGWSLPGYEGGSGGHGKGATGEDGSGGGGASVIELNGELAVAAGGGGGQGGDNQRFIGLHGGSAGFERGGDGGVPKDQVSYNLPGYGGGPEHQNNDSLGKSVPNNAGITPDRLGGGGGGGGGGRYVGAGGAPGREAVGAGGGGGSSWVSDAVSDVVAHVDSDGTNAGGGHPGNGFVRLRWVADVTTYTITKRGTPDVQNLQAGDSDTQDGAAVSTGRAAATAGEAVATQTWAFHRDDSGPANVGGLVNLSTGKCLDVNGHTGALDLWTCDGGNNQRWRMSTRSDGTVSLQVVDQRSADGSYLATTVDPASITDNSPVILEPTPESPRTVWEAHVVG